MPRPGKRWGVEYVYTHTHSYGCIAKEIVVRKTMNTRKPVVPYESKRQQEEKQQQLQLQQQQQAAKNKVSVDDDLVGGDWEEVQVMYACRHVCVCVCVCRCMRIGTKVSLDGELVRSLTQECRPGRWMSCVRVWLCAYNHAYTYINILNKGCSGRWNAL